MTFKPFEALSLLAKRDGAISRFSLETPYGLIVEVEADGTIDVHLSAEGGSNAASAESKQSGFRYYIMPDYQTTFLWYITGWPGNPSDEGHCAVEFEEMRERYSEFWVNAYDAWVDAYTHAFEAQECQLGSGKEPFPDPEERIAWELEGMLLAIWLSLQPDVNAVDYQGVADGQVTFLLDKESVGEKLGKLLRDLIQGS